MEQQNADEEEKNAKLFHKTLRDSTLLTPF